MSTPSDDETPRITYAQNWEDVRLWKALADCEVRTYVDIGAGDPTEFSVTRLFYDRGWRGINIEPGPRFSALKRDRPEDVNLQVAVADKDDVAEFHVAYPYSDLSSLDPAAPAADPDHVDRLDVVEMQTLRLSTILSEHLSGRRIAFMKVDTEGTEFDVLSSNDWSQFRPFILVVEAVAPGSHTPSHEKWEPILLEAGYEFAVFDGINRFYAVGDRSDLIERLREPVSALDYFIPYPLVAAWAKQGSDQGALTQYMARIRHMDGELKLIQVEHRNAEADLRQAREELRQANRHNQELIAHVHELGARILELDVTRTELRQRVADMENAWSWRLGQGIVGVAKPVKHLLNPTTVDVKGRGEIDRREVEDVSPIEQSAPAKVRAAYQAATAPGKPLETVMTMDRPEAYSPGAARFSIDPLDAVWRELGPRRRDRPRLLTADEITLLEQFVADDHFVSDDHAEATSVVNKILALHQKPDDLRVPRAASTLVIDVRALQIPAWCGIKSHAAYMLRSVLAHVRGRARVLFLTTPQWPRLDPEFAALGDGEWEGRAGDLETVGGFLQLAPFLMATETSAMNLLRAPWIKRAIAWHDAIVGVYPHAYLKDPVEFLHYQLGLEQVRRHDRILAVSQSSASEAIDLLGDHDHVVVTGNVSSIGARGSVLQSEELPFKQFVLALGNGAPHKNLAAAVAGFVPFAVRGPEELGLVIVSHLMSDDQIHALKELARNLGLEPHRLVYLSQVPKDQLLQLFEGAAATVIPSFHEGFSLPVIESLGAGTPVVVSDIAPHRELLGEGTWFFPADDPTALSTALEGVLADPTACLSEQQSRVGRRFDGRIFDEAVADVVNFLVEDLETGLGGETTTVSFALDPIEESSHEPLSLSKICELEDFSNSRLEPVIRDVFSHELIRFGADFPRHREWRKYWEVAMTILTFRECGLLNGNYEFLGIGAGNEPTTFYLTRFARRVLATDLYLSEGWDESANTSMLTNPDVHWPFTWNPNRLTVEHMNALGLRLEDESVDAIFSSSSIEHFGERSDVARALDEAFRVLTPGGVLSISSEFRLRGERPGVPGALMFDEDDIERLFLGSRDWSLIEPFDSKVSAATMATNAEFEKVASDQISQVARYGGLWTHHLEFAQYPHIVLSFPNHTFTSFHLALRKAGELRPSG